MSTYIEFLKQNYSANDSINIMSFHHSGTVRNEIQKVGYIQKAAGGYDTYMSMNPLISIHGKIKRDKEHIGRLKWLYVDLDYYHSNYADYSKKQIIGLLELDYFNSEIPVPTYIIDSGRGLYLLWRLDENVKAYSRWVKMQKYLTGKLEEFGADYKVASDSARVLRQVGSINSKSGTEVSVLQHNDKKYSLTTLMREYVVDEKPSEKLIHYAKSISNILELPLPDTGDKEALRKFIRENKEPANLFFQQKRGQEKIREKRMGKIRFLGTEYSLLRNRVADIETLLIKHRDMPSGHREHILFLYRYWMCCITGSVDEALNATLVLNSRLKYPLTEKEAVQATASAEKYFLAGKIFRCSNSYVIQALNITECEMKDLKVFISLQEATQRKQNRNRIYYKKKLQHEQKRTKEEQVKIRRTEISKLLKKGYSAEDICRKLNISRATFFADKKAIERYLASRKEHVAAQKGRYAKFCKKLENSSLKNSAFVLYMSFRTWQPLPFSFGQVFSAPALSRFLRSTLATYLSALDSPGFLFSPRLFRWGFPVDNLLLR